MNTSAARAALHRTIWRWHFYAGLFVLPFVVLLSITGAFYLFKPQIERWEERAFRNLPAGTVVSAEAQLEVALAGFPGARFQSYRLPEQPTDSAMLRLVLADNRTTRDVFVSPGGTLLGSLDPTQRLMEIDKRVHGQLLVGERGGWLVELAGSWAVVLVLSGLYLWWPRSGGLAGTLWPRLSCGPRLFWRDLHAVTGVWISGFVLVLLVTALPWTGLWGSAFKTLRTEMGWVAGRQEWALGGRAPGDIPEDAHAGHDHAGKAGAAAAPGNTLGLGAIVARAQAERLPFPVIVTPPGAPGAFGAVPAMTWSVRSDSQRRPLQQTLTFDASSPRPLSRTTFADKHIIDRVVGYGIAWHEGQLFGWVTQLIGVFTALGVLTMAISGFVMWRRRKPATQLGAPQAIAIPARMGGVVVLVFALAILLPLLAASLITLLLLESLVLPHLPRLARWLGLQPSGRH